MTVPGETDVVGDVAIDAAWTLVEEFSSLVRDSGAADERLAVSKITERLTEWDIAHTLHEPELLVSLPLSASLIVDGKRYAAKTPSLAASTGDNGLTAPLTTSRDDVAGKVMLARGFPASVPVRDLQRAGAVGVICISPGERIHEAICTSVWGEPPLSPPGRPSNGGAHVLHPREVRGTSSGRWRTSAPRLISWRSWPRR